MFAFFKKFLRLKDQQKKIAFIDGDQDLHKVLETYQKYVANTNTETHLVRLKRESHNEPKILRKTKNINKIYLDGYTSKKEVVDKFIGAYIQKAVSDGYKEISVISSDYDFIDIFKMAVRIDPNATNILFKMIVPHAEGRLCDLPEKILNIEIIK